MAITFRHDAAAGLVGSFAAGEAAGRRRNQKYSMALLMQNQRDRNRLRALGGVRGGRARAFAPEGQFEPDPLADDPTLTPKDRRIIAARRRARERKIRLGKDVPFDIRQNFIPQAQIDRQNELDDEQRENDREDLIRGETRGFAVADKRAAAEQAVRNTGLAFDRKQLNDGPYSEDQKARGNKALTDRGLIGTNTGLSESERQAELAKQDAILDEIRNDPQGVAAQTPIDRANENLGLFDPDQNRFVSSEEAGPNAYPVPINDGQPNFSQAQTPDDGSAARSLRVKRRAASKALGAAQEAQRARLADDVLPGEDEARFFQDNVDRAQEALDDIDGQMESLDDKWNEETIEKKGARVQHLGEGKGFSKIDLGGEEEDAAATAKAREDFIVNKINEILNAQDADGFEGKKLTEDQAYTKAVGLAERDEKMRQRARDDATRDERMRQRIRDEQPRPGVAGQVPIRRGAAGLDDLVTNTPSGIDLELDPGTVPLPPPAPNPNMAGLTPQQFAAAEEQAIAGVGGQQPAPQPGPAEAVAPAPQAERLTPEERSEMQRRTREGTWQEEGAKGLREKLQRRAEQDRRVGLPRVATDADYAGLAPGAEFIDPETDKLYKKPYAPKVDLSQPTMFEMMVR